MLFWIAAALLTFGACLAVLMPLARRPAARAAPVEHDIAVYKDQLAEVERDRARGLIGATEAEEARAEIGRRILRLSAHDMEGAARPAGAPRAAALAAVFVILLVSWGGYAWLGSPDLPAQPLAARLEGDPAGNTMEELVARAERHLAQNPDDGRGWEVLAPIYVRMGRFDDAATAYRAAIRLQGASAAREAGLGEAIAAAADGVVSSEAVAAFRRALALEPGQPKARFFLATALAQEGKLSEAVAAWQELRTALPPDSPWAGAAGNAIAEAERRMADASGAPAPGPSQQDVEAAAGMAPADRTAMIVSMVEGLDQKLRQNPRDRDGWQRLIRSYMVLDRRDEARDALERAIAAFGKDSPEAGELAAFAATLGLTTTE